MPYFLLAEQKIQSLSLRQKNMPTTFIIHGVYGHPEENWFPWLRDELEKRGHKVYIPQFPTPEGQTLDNWLEVFEEYKEEMDEDTIVVGHSLGPAFLLTVLEKLSKPIKAAYFVAGYNPGSLPKTSEWYEMVQTFVDKEFDWEKIRQNCKEFHIFHSDDDPYFPQYLAEDLGKNLNTKPTIIEGAGHFNEKAGYTKFEELLEAIEKC